MHNTKLFSGDGYIGRRNFIINYLLIQIFLAVIKSIHSWISLFLILFFPNIVKLLPLKYIPDEILAFFTALLEVILISTLVKRRVYDIIGDESQNKLWIYTSFFNIVAIFLFSYISSLSNSKLLEFNFGMMILIPLCFISFLFLFCKKGTISSKEEPNTLNKFNWGAFIGTWIWGIFNNIKKAFLAIILFFVGSGAGFNFALICGIKGNEWVKNKKDNLSIEEIHTQQRKQTKIMCVLIPIVIIISMLGLVSFVRYNDNYQCITRKADRVIKTIAKNTTIAIFDKVEFVDGKYCFYINSKDWNNMSFSDKSDLFEMAVFSILYDKNLSCFNDIPVDIINNTVFYDSENNRYLLGCNIPEDYGKTITTKNKYHRKVIKTFLHN